LNDDKLKQEIAALLSAKRFEGKSEFVFSQRIISDEWKRFFQRRGIKIFARGETPTGIRPIRASFELPSEVPDDL
jgi:hypothetical protein